MTDTTPTPAPAPAPQVWPTLRANDARGLIRFLVDVVGFEDTVVYGEGEAVAHAQLSWPLGGGIMLGSTRDSDDPADWSLQPGAFGAYVVCADEAAVDALYAKCKAGERRSCANSPTRTTARASSASAIPRATAGPSAAIGANRAGADCRVLIDDIGP